MQTVQLVHIYALPIHIRALVCMVAEVAGGGKLHRSTPLPLESSQDERKNRQEKADS